MVLCGFGTCGKCRILFYVDLALAESVEVVFLRIWHSGVWKCVSWRTKGLERQWGRSGRSCSRALGHSGPWSAVMSPRDTGASLWVCPAGAGRVNWTTTALGSQGPGLMYSFCVYAWMAFQTNSAHHKHPPGTNRYSC